VPPGLQGVVERDVSLKQIRAGWDSLVHVASSIEGGWASAVLALERLGSAARADTTYKAGTALGKLLLSLFLCDYLSNSAFRRDILRLLNRGESVHALQRAIHEGRVAPAHGRREEELVAISGSLTLLTNITMAWITHRMQAVLDEREKAHQPLDPAILRHLGPVHSAHINFRGTFQFPLERFEKRLLTGRLGARPAAHSG
jgi:TnpA family transposase